LLDAVQSILTQDYQRTLVVVTSDGDQGRPWLALGDLVRHPRVLTIELGQSLGPYYAHDIALRGSPFEFFAVQDADDVSTPQRLSTLVSLIDTTRADAAFGVVREVGLTGQQALNIPRVFETGVGMRHFVDHFGVFRRRSLLAIGGYYGGVRFGYDTFIVSSLGARGRCVATDDVVVYERHARPESLTRAAETGIGSPPRREYVQLLRDRFLRAEATPAFREAIREHAVSRNERDLIDKAATDLRGRLEARIAELGEQGW
jgi:hypothetical protein